MKNSSPARRTLWLALLLITLCGIALCFSTTRPSEASSRNSNQTAKDVNSQQDSCPTCPAEPAALKQFRASVNGTVTPVIIELKDEPGVVQKALAEQAGRKMSVDKLVAYSRELRDKQDTFRQSLQARNIRALMREADVEQVDGSIRHIEYRFHYLLNGFVAYVASEDLARLRSLPEVKKVYEPQPLYLMLDKAIDYTLGTQSDVNARRDAVYGATKEWSPVGSIGHPETPEAAKIDGYEGQGMNIAVIDTGIDWRHPMFGGTGLTTPAPRTSGQPESAGDNKKVIYYYALSSPGKPNDDFGHGTLVASCAAGYKVDGSTPPNPGYGTGKDGTGVGPVPNGTTLHGTAPQARLMAYKVCGPANQCLGDSELAIEDAASPFTIVGSSDGTKTVTTVAKPVADVINLSLGDTAGDPTSASAKAANNAALAGVIVVAAAGNEGPGASTLGAPSVGTLAISVAASLDPGSISVGGVLAPNQIPGETRAAVPGPPPETGATSDANTAQPNERQNIKLFPVAGGGAIPDGSLSAHYVYVDETSGSPPPTSITNRIALVEGTGAFANIANEVAPLKPAAILIITDIDSATALVVVGAIPTYTINPADANYLLDIIDGTHNHTNTPHGTISQYPLRLAESEPLSQFNGSIAGFSSRGPEGNPNARYRAIKPDVAAPGVGIYGAAVPDGLQDAATGLSNPSGYIHANGTSFASPITAGAMALVRQRVREELGLDTTDLSNTHYRSKRFDVVTVSRALLMNTSTNLRSGLGVPQADGTATASINDMGAGLINIDGALKAKAIMVAPTFLRTDEFTAPTNDPPPNSDFDAAHNLKVFIPSVSFGSVPVVGVGATVVRTHEVVIRDVTGGGGGGSYTLTYQDNRNTNVAGVSVSFLAADGTTPTTTVTVPAGGQASFFVKIAVDGTKLAADPTELQWYVTATGSGANKTLRMPFYYRAVKPDIANIASPVQGAITGTEQPAPSPSPSPNCPVDTNGNYTLNWTYTAPDGGPAPVGFRVQEGTRTETKFFDNADEPLVGGANSKWTGSAQWISQLNPNTGSPAYYIADTANQDESLAMVTAVALPAGGATLSFVTTQDLEDNFDYGFVEVSTDGGTNYNTVATFTGAFTGTRNIDISAYAGQSIKVRFRFKSDLLNDPPQPVGWYIEDITISSDDFHTIGDTAANATSLNITGRGSGSYFYRIAGLFDTPLGVAPGPYSNTQCVTVTGVVVTPTPTPTPSPTPIPTPTPTATPTPSPTPTPTATPVPKTVGLSATVYTVNEAVAEGVATVTVNRGGDTSAAITVEYSTSDSAGMTPCQNNGNGFASERCDYSTQAGTLRFAAGEGSKTIQIPINNDAYVEPNESFYIALRNAQGASLGTSSATITIQSDDTQQATQNPINDTAFFIRQLYVDFLGRTAEPEGFNFWYARMTDPSKCTGQSEPCDRIDTAKRFFESDEFQERGFYVYRLFDATLGRFPKYSEFIPDVSRLNGFQSVSEQRLAKDAYLLDFMDRAEFRALYDQYLTPDHGHARDSASAAAFVDALCSKAGITPANKQALITNLQNGTRDPAHTLEDFILQPEIGGVGTRYYDRARIVMQYFGFLRRDPEQGGFDFWWDRLTKQEFGHYHDYRWMVGGFLNSDEYNFRYAFIKASQ